MFNGRKIHGWEDREPGLTFMSCDVGMDLMIYWLVLLSNDEKETRAIPFLYSLFDEHWDLGRLQCGRKKLWHISTPFQKPFSSVSRGQKSFKIVLSFAWQILNINIHFLCSFYWPSELPSPRFKSEKALVSILFPSTSTTLRTEFPSVKP